MFKKLKKNKPQTTKNALNIINHLCIQGKPGMQRLMTEERTNAAIARQIQHLRTKAGLTQTQLAKRVGTTASVICRLEDADYEGHSVSMLHRIAAALNQRIEMRFIKATGISLQPT